MHPSISFYPSNQFYDGLIINHNSVESREIPAVFQGFKDLMQS